jgi:hypothetical protein
MHKYGRTCKNVHSYLNATEPATFRRAFRPNGWRTSLYRQESEAKKGAGAQYAACATTRGIAKKGCNAGVCAYPTRGQTFSHGSSLVPLQFFSRPQRAPSALQPFFARTCPTRGTLPGREAAPAAKGAAHQVVFNLLTEARGSRAHRRNRCAR